MVEVEAIGPRFPKAAFGFRLIGNDCSVLEVGLLAPILTLSALESRLAIINVGDGLEVSSATLTSICILSSIWIQHPLTEWCACPVGRLRFCWVEEDRTIRHHETALWILQRTLPTIIYEERIVVRRWRKWVSVRFQVEGRVSTIVFLDDVHALVTATCI